VGGGLYGAGNNAIELDDNGTVIVDRGASVTASGVGPSSAAIHPIDGGTTIINSGTINGGPTSAIFFENLNASAATPRNVIQNFGVINTPGGGADPTFSRQAVGSNGAVGIDFINGPNAVVAGNLDLQGGNDNVTLFAGSRITGDLNGGGGANTLTLDGAAGTADTRTGSLNNFETLTKAGAGTWTLTDALGDNGGATPLGVTVPNGTLILTGDNPAFNGTMLVSPNGTLQLGNGGASGNLSGNITDNGAVAFDRSDTVTFPSVISGTGSLNQIGLGTTILTGSNAYTGGTVISAGTLQIGAGGTTGSILGNVTDNGTLAFNRSGTVTFPGVISGTGGLNQIGPGTLILTSDNTYTGDTVISAGTLQIGNGGTTGSIVGNVVDNTSLVLDRSGLLTLPGVISGLGSLTQIGPGTTILTGNNTYTGGTVISAGTLQIGNGGTTGAVVGDITDNGALVVDRSGTLTLPGVISGPGSLSQIGPGTTILTASNTYTGGTSISAGTLQLGNGGTTGSIVGPVTDNGTLAFDRSDVVVLPGAISGSGSVSQIGAGTTILTANNPFTGGTNVSAGTLAVGDPADPNAALSGGGPVSVASGATLGGYGSVTGAVANNGTIAVANALPVFAAGPVGTFTINGSLLNQGVVNLASSSAIGNVLRVNGNYASVGGTLVLNTLLNAGGPLSGQFTDRLLVNGGAGGITGIQVNGSGAGAATNTTGVGPANRQGISMVQVAGASSPSAFQLANGFVTAGTAYTYRLFAFGPGSQFGPADPSQSLVGGGGSNWDYRLESSFVSNSSTVRLEVAPQVASYITAPTALFNADFENLDSLHRRLGEIRDDQRQNRAQHGELFIRTYGYRFNYTSDRSFEDFGFNSQQDYVATQFGGNWIATDNEDGTLRVGLAGILGRLWFQPSAPDGPSKGRFNQEILAGTITWQSRQGWYMDGIITGGMFDGQFTTPARGETTGMNGASFDASIEAGYPFPLGEKVAIEPQVQFVYQHLDFARRTDVDGINVDLGSPNQGVFRGGARLTKLFETEDGTLVTPYLKANVLQGLGGGDSVQLSSQPFGTGHFGTALQIGAGMTGTLTRNLSIYGDVAWQHQVSSGGFRGWALNGGIRYALGVAPLPVPGPVARPLIARSYLVFFNWDHADLTDRARQIVAEAAANFGRVQVTQIEVNGHTDTSGTPRYNQGLSVARAKTVQAELIRDGVPENAITIRGFGQTHLLVPTGPNVRSPPNRRVEIIFH
jgi:outer membrane autotransporter protein